MVSLNQLSSSFQVRLDVFHYSWRFVFENRQQIFEAAATYMKVTTKLLLLKALNAKHKADVYHFWNLVPDTDYPSFKQCVHKVILICESTFSTMKIVKKKQRNKLSNAHLDYLTTIAVTNHKYSMTRVKQQLAHIRSSQH